MLRLIFVFGIILVGAFYSLRGPFFALLFYLWNAYFRPEYWVWNDVLWSLRLSLVIGGFLLLSSLPFLHRFRLTPLVSLMVLFMAQAGISVVFSPHQPLALPFLTEFLKIGVISLLITVLVDSEKRYRLTLMVIAFSLGFEAAKQGWAQLLLNPGATNTNQHLMLGDNNGVAMGMMMLIPIFMALSQTAVSSRERLIDRFFIGGVIYRGISTYSRGGFLAGAVIALISLWRAKHRLRTIVIVAVLASVVATVMPQQFWDRMQSITATGDERDSSAQSRLYFWSLAVEMADDRPMVGVGFNSFRYSFADYNLDPSFAGMVRTVHSSWFGVLSELGYPGLLIFVALIGWSIRTCQRVKKVAAARGAPNLAIYAAHLQTSLLVFVVGGSFLSAHYLELLWHTFALTAALDHICHAAAVAPAVARIEASRPAAPTIPRFRPQVPPRVAGGGRFFHTASRKP